MSNNLKECGPKKSGEATEKVKTVFYCIRKEVRVNKETELCGKGGKRGIPCTITSFVCEQSRKASRQILPLGHHPECILLRCIHLLSVCYACQDSLLGEWLVKVEGCGRRERAR